MLVNGAGGAVALAVGSDHANLMVQAAQLLLIQDLVRITDIGGRPFDATIFRQKYWVRILFFRLCTQEDTGLQVAAVDVGDRSIIPTSCGSSVVELLAPPCPASDHGRRFG